MERELNIKTSDNKVLYGLLRGKTKQLVVFVHGFTSSFNESKFNNGARFLERHGYSSYRFGLYDWRTHARKLHECTFHTHGRDIDTVVRYFRKKGYKKIYIVGHSYGGPSILCSQEKDFDKIIFWDGSSLALSKQWATPDSRSARLNKTLDAYKVRLTSASGFEVLVSRQFDDEVRNLDQIPLFEHIAVPTQFICAGKGILVQENLRFYHHVSAPKDFVVIENAEHNFEEEGVENILFKETLRWLKHDHGKK